MFHWENGKRAPAHFQFERGYMECLRAQYVSIISDVIKSHIRKVFYYTLLEIKIEIMSVIMSTYEFNR